MPDYKTQFSPTMPLELEFYDRDGNPIGKLRIKQSTILWKPFNKSRFRSVSLESVAKWIYENGTLVSR